MEKLKGIPEKKISSAEKKKGDSEKKLSSTEKKKGAPEKKISSTEKKKGDPEKKLSSTEKKKGVPEEKISSTEKKKVAPEKLIQMKKKKEDSPYAGIVSELFKNVRTKGEFNGIIVKISLRCNVKSPDLSRLVSYYFLITSHANQEIGVPSCVDVTS